MQMVAQLALSMVQTNGMQTSFSLKAGQIWLRWACTLPLTALNALAHVLCCQKHVLGFAVEAGCLQLNLQCQ